MLPKLKAPAKSDCSESDGEEGKLHTYDEVEALLLSQIPTYVPSPPHVSRHNSRFYQASTRPLVRARSRLT